MAIHALKEEDWISTTSKNVILCHHEHIDGSGYPLHAVSLSVESKIVCACNKFDELISGIGCKRIKVL
jgi:HD-GYP domain-containing protein (c-di-GMP phosphodiesterase class II)